MRGQSRSVTRPFQSSSGRKVRDHDRDRAQDRTARRRLSRSMSRSKSSPGPRSRSRSRGAADGRGRYRKAGREGKGRDRRGSHRNRKRNTFHTEARDRNSGGSGRGSSVHSGSSAGAEKEPAGGPAKNPAPLEEEASFREILEARRASLNNVPCPNAAAADHEVATAVTGATEPETEPSRRKSELGDAHGAAVGSGTAPASEKDEVSTELGSQSACEAVEKCEIPDLTNETDMGLTGSRRKKTETKKTRGANHGRGATSFK